MTATPYVVINIYNKEFLSKQQIVILKFYRFLFLSKFFLMYVLYVYIKVTIIIIIFLMKGCNYILKHILKLC